MILIYFVKLTSDAKGNVGYAKYNYLHFWLMFKFSTSQAFQGPTFGFDAEGMSFKILSFSIVTLHIKTTKENVSSFNSVLMSLLSIQIHKYCFMSVIKKSA